MTEQSQSPICGNGENQPATSEDFLRIFSENLNRLYQLAFLLTADQQKGEECFLAAVEDCAKENRVIRTFAWAWAKRAIVENAIRTLNPRPSRSYSRAVPILFPEIQQLSVPIGHFDAQTVLRLPDFERFVFVLSVLERYRERECALLLGCPASQVQKARPRAIEELARSSQVTSSRHGDCTQGQRAAARTS